MLRDLQQTQRLSLLSYSSLDVFGAGSFQARGALALHAAEIRGFGVGSGTASFSAESLLLDNGAHATGQGPVSDLSGAIAFRARDIRLGVNSLAVSQFSVVELTATDSFTVQGAGAFSVQGDLQVNTHALTASRAATYSIVAGGDFTLSDTPASGGKVSAGLGASLTLQGASLAVNTDILLPSGLLTLRATAGDLTVGRVLMWPAPHNSFTTSRNTPGPARSPLRPMPAR